MNEVDNQSFLNSQELSMVFEIVAEKFLPHFEGEKEIWDKLRMMKLPYTLDNVMHIMHLKWSINEECDRLGEYDDHNNTPKEKK